MITPNLKVQISKSLIKENAKQEKLDILMKKLEKLRKKAINR